MWRGHRASGTEAIIAFVLMLCVWFLALPILGIAGIASHNEDEKAKGILCLIAFGIICMVLICM